MGEGDIEDVYEDLDTDVSFEEFQEAVAAKVEQMGGLADEETAAMLVAHELGESEVEGIADIEPGMEDVQFLGKVIDVGEITTFERDDGDEGRVLNVEIADETGSIRVAFWDRMAEDAAENLEAGDVLRVGGRPSEGYSGVEVNADDVEMADEEDVDVQVGDGYDVADLSLGMSGVNVRGRVLETDSVRTFDRDDGSEGRVASVAIGDETGRVRVTLWDDMTEHAERLSAGESIEVVDGYVRERDGDLELHLNDRSEVVDLDEDVTYEPDSTPIDAVEIGQRVDIAGVVRSADPKRTFDRDDGSEGQVRNVRVQDDSGDIRVALWGDKADIEVGPGDRVAIADVEIQDGWQDDLEASANWRSTVTVLGEAGPAGGPTAGQGSTGSDREAGQSPADTGLDAFAGEDGPDDAPSSEEATATEDGGGSTAVAAERAADADGQERVEFTGTVVQAADPVVLDDGQQTIQVDTDEDVRLGEEITVRGRRREGRVDADEIL